MIDSDRLRAFEAFGELLNFTHAAERLHVSQPSLHAQVKKLERELDARLYERVGRELRLTPAGAKVLAHARDARRRDERFRAELAGLPHGAPLVLAAGEGALLYLLGASLRALERAHGRQLRVLTRNAQQTVRAVQTAEANVGVTVTSSQHEGLSSTRLKWVGQKAVILRGHPLAKRRAVTVQQISEFPIVSAPVGSPHRTALERLFAGASAPFEVAVEANGWVPMMHLASLGLGVAIVNDFCAVPSGSVGRRIRGAPKLEYRLLWRSDDASRETDLMKRALSC